MNKTINNLLIKLDSHQKKANTSLNFTPSENVMSPLSRVPLVMDIYSRYFFEHKKLFGEWFFFGGIEAGEIQGEYTEPVLRKLTKANYVDVRPLSGLNCMTIVMAALCKKGGNMLTIPEPFGGHMSSANVAKRLGINANEIPFDNHEIDLDLFMLQVKKIKPDLIYIDQSTQLFPIDPMPLRKIIDIHSPMTKIHYDSSHINGLILTGAIFNPLENGAHSFGGSTHKTLPGPHKAFFATNDKIIYSLFDDIAYHFISHNQVASSISLAITLLELMECNGVLYAQRIIENAKLFANGISNNGIPVAAKHKGFTNCHQVWIGTPKGMSADKIASQMYNLGILVNKLPCLPLFDTPSFRFSLAEITKLGATSKEMPQLINIISTLINQENLKQDQLESISLEMQSLKSKLSKPKYCFTSQQLAQTNTPKEILNIMKSIEDMSANYH
jgi:glycine/serine hydroxymethyltransferase